MRSLIVVGVITRGRARTFGELLTSLAALEHPDGCDVAFAFVENDTTAHLTEIVDAFRARVPGCRTFYELEERLGIPMARNKVLDIGFREGADYLAFIDDDETADPGWLKHLHAELVTRPLDLVGGPVRLHPHPLEANALQRCVWRGLVRRNHRIEIRAAHLHAEKRDSKVTVVTSNWLVRMSFLRQTGIRFDEALGFSGGSDTRIYREMRRAAARTGWAPLALVREFMPLQRLSLAYQYRRGRDQAMASYHNKYEHTTVMTVLRSLGFMAYKALSAVGLAVVSVFNSGASLMDAARAWGFVMGRAQAVLGHRSRQYETIQRH